MRRWGAAAGLRNVHENVSGVVYSLGQLLSGVRTAKQHNTSFVLLISGPAGIGKTTVLSEP